MARNKGFEKFKNSKKNKKQRHISEAAKKYVETSVETEELETEIEIETGKVPEESPVETRIVELISSIEEPSEENWEEDEIPLNEEPTVVEPSITEEVEAPVNEEPPRTKVKGFVNPVKTVQNEEEVPVYPMWVSGNHLACFYNQETKHPSVYGLVSPASPGLYVGIVQKGVTMNGRPNCHGALVQENVGSGQISSFFTNLEEELNVYKSIPTHVHMSETMVIAYFTEILHDVGAAKFKELIATTSWDIILEGYKNLRFVGCSKSGKNTTFVFETIDNEDGN